MSTLRKTVAKLSSINDFDSFELKDLYKLKFNWKYKPILIGGKLKELLNLRKSGLDIDLIVSTVDYEEISKIENMTILRQLEERGATIYSNGIQFEFWETIMKLSYDYWIKNALECKNFYILSPFDQIAMSTFASVVLKPEKREKQIKDALALSNKISDILYPKDVRTQLI